MSESHIEAPEDTEEPAPGEEISYQTFGEHFIRHMVTVPRLHGELESLLQATIEGSTDALPRDLLVASYRFQPRDMHIERRIGEEAEVGFELRLGGVLTLSVKVMSVPVSLPMDVDIRIAIDVRTFAPLTIKLQPRRLRNRDVRVTTQMPRELRALPTKLLDRVNPLAIAVAENIVRQVNRRLEQPGLEESTTIDVLALANKAMGAD